MKFTVDSTEDWTRDALLAAANEIREAASELDIVESPGEDPALPGRMRACADEIEALVATGYWND